MSGVDALLLREERFLAQPCELVRFWETDVRDQDGQSHTLAMIVYSHGYRTEGLADVRSLRFAVYAGDRQLTGGIIA